MAEKTEISWCDSTWSPVWGCTEVSPACTHCYARVLAHRFGYGWNGEPMREFGDHHWNEPRRWAKRDFYECTDPTCRWRGDRLGVTSSGATEHYCPICSAPIKLTRRRVFPSMCDPFDKDWPAGVRERFWQLIADTPNLTWLLLTKRVGNVAKMVPPEWLMRDVGCRNPNRWPDNVWIGSTVIDQEEFDRDVPKLLVDVPARVRFLSIEPMLGPINMSMRTDRVELPEGLSWIISGGESGPHARPAQPDWFRSLRDQCAAAGVPFLHKQNGQFAPVTIKLAEFYKPTEQHIGEQPLEWGPIEDEVTVLRRMSKKAAGRLLDGVTHDGMPKAP